MAGVKGGMGRVFEHEFHVGCAETAGLLWPAKSKHRITVDRFLDKYPMLVPGVNVRSALAALACATEENPVKCRDYADTRETRYWLVPGPGI